MQTAIMLIMIPWDILFLGDLQGKQGSRLTSARVCCLREGVEGKAAGQPRDGLLGHGASCFLCGKPGRVGGSCPYKATLCGPLSLCPVAFGFFRHGRLLSEVEVGGTAVAFGFFSMAVAL